jgi:hypothetical protein
MKRRKGLMTAILVGLMIVGSVTALAQEKKVKPTKENVAAKKMKQPEATKTKMTLGEAAKLSPATLLSMAKELELTDVQQKKLWMIMQEMHAKTAEILTKDQFVKVKTWKPLPTMAETMKMAAKMEKTKIPQEK